MRRFSRPVRYASTAAYWPDRPIRCRTAPACATTSKPATRARPASGASSVARIRTVVVLPAPFGPSSASTLPVASSRSTPSSARTAPKRLVSPSATIAGRPSALVGWCFGVVVVVPVAGDQSPTIVHAMPRVSAETKQATRARLLAAAAEEFGRVGLARANVDAISLAAGFAKGTIYNYFPSKEDLFLAVVEEAVAQATAAGSAPTEAPAWERLAATLAGFCAWAGQHDPFARVLVRECLMGTPGLYPRVIEAEAPLVGELAAILRQGTARGELRDDVPAELLARAIAGLTDLALVEHWASDDSTPRLEAIPELVLTLLLGPRSAAGPRPDQPA